MNYSLNRAQWKIIASVLLVAISGSLGIDIHLASLPHIMEALHTNQQHMQQSISLFILGIGSSLLIYGPLSDKYGRKPVICIGMMIAALSSFGAAFSNTIFLFLTMRLLQGIGSGVCWGLARTVAADILTVEQMSIIGSYITLFFSLSPMTAPLIGGYVQTYLGWQANFVLLGLILLIALLLFMKFCPETNKHKNPKAFTLKGLWKNYSSLLTHPVFLGCTLIAGLTMGATMAYATTSSFIFQKHFMFSAIAFGWAMACVEVGGIFGKIANAPCVKYFGPLKSTVLGLTLFVVGSICMLLIFFLHMMNAYLFIALVMIISFGNILASFNTMAFALVPFKKKRGSAAALYGSFQMLTSFITSAILASITGAGILLLSSTYFILGALGLIVTFTMIWGRTKSE